MVLNKQKHTSAVTFGHWDTSNMWRFLHIEAIPWTIASVTQELCETSKSESKEQPEIAERIFASESLGHDDISRLCRMGHCTVIYDMFVLFKDNVINKGHLQAVNYTDEVLIYR